MNRYGQQYYQNQMIGASEQPVIEVDGQLRFSLPGTPIFPSLTDESILKPRLEWMLATDKGGKFPAEFSYVTGGMTWQADYNIVAPEKGDLVDIVGWVTMDNQSGKTFENARIKLMAGDVNKIQPGAINGRNYSQAIDIGAAAAMPGSRPSPRKLSTSTTSTRSNAPRRCATAKPSKWNSLQRRA